MTTRGVLINILIISIMSIFLVFCKKIDATYVGKLPSISGLMGAVSKICHTVEALPEKLCHNTVGLVGTTAKKVCGSGATQICNQISLKNKCLLPTVLFNTVSSMVQKPVLKEQCEKMINQYLCGSMDTAIGYVEKECTGELGRYSVIGQGLDANGNKVSICDGPPTTVEKVCPLLVAAMCRQLPPLLHSFNSLCEVTFAQMICKGVIDAVKPLVPKLLK